MEPECKVRLKVFEGPLDLLLHLINKNKLDIKDIPISLVTTQYLEYLTFLKALNIEVAAEYLVMAATLMHIKSKMLLPRNEESDSNNDEADPRLEITKALNELKKAKEYAEALNSQPILERDVFIRPLQNELRRKDVQSVDISFEVNLIDLVDAFKDVLKGKPLPKTIEIERAKVDLDYRICEIESLLSSKKNISFFSLFEKGADRFLIIVTFLAILELAKRGLVRLFQQEEGSDILILKRENEY